MRWPAFSAARESDAGRDGSFRGRSPSWMPGLRKDLDLQVVSPVEQFGPLPEGSVWPSIYRLLGDLIREHRSTIVFANNRRSVERITAFLNDEEEIARAHHGSVVAGSAAAGRGGAEGRPAAGRGGDGVAGTGHRHGGGRSGLPGRVAGQRRAGLAAGRPGRAPRRPDEQGPAHPQDGGRPAGTGRAGAGDGRRPRRGDPRAGQLPGRAGPAARGPGGDGRLDRAGTVRAGAAGVSLSRSVAAGVRDDVGDD